MKHRTFHAAEPADGKVLVACSCGWKDWVEVYGLAYWVALATIYEARDAHEAEHEAESQVSA